MSDPQPDRQGNIWWSRGDRDCKGEARFERKDGMVVITCASCSLHWATPERKSL